MRHLAETNICRTQAHCATCRDREGGRSWRESVMAAFIVPPADSARPAVDWLCPRGHAWGDRPVRLKTSVSSVEPSLPKPDILNVPPERRRPVRTTPPPPAFLPARLEACSRCEHTNCAMKHMTACQRRARLKRPSMACPIGTWGRQVSTGQ